MERLVYLYLVCVGFLCDILLDSNCGCTLCMMLCNTIVLSMLCTIETLQRWRMLKWRLMMERMSLWYQTPCISKFGQFGLQALFYTAPLWRSTFNCTITIILFCSNIRKKITPFVMSFGFR